MERNDEDAKDMQSQIELSQILVSNEDNNEMPEEVALDDIPMFGE